MIQKTFEVTGEHSLDSILMEIRGMRGYDSASARLVQIYEPNTDKNFIQAMLNNVKSKLPECRVIGMTTLGPVKKENITQKNTVISVILFKESGFRISVYDCYSMDVSFAGRLFTQSLCLIDDLRGILVMSSCARLYPTDFIERINKDYPDIPIFGAQAGTEVLIDDRSKIFIDDMIYTRGIMAVCFYGKELSIRTDCNLGWRALGKEMTVTGIAREGFITSIDDQPAISIYKKYLDVVPDEYFFENVCAFPLLMKNGNMRLGRVPLDYTSDGRLQFSMTIEKNSKLMLSYSKPRYLLKKTLFYANEMSKFKPEAIMLYACMNRRVFMGNENADKEFNYYKAVNPETLTGCGYGEIYKSSDGGGILNSTIVAVGMREGAIPNDYEPVKVSDLEVESEDYSSIPIWERLVTFLEATTSELDEKIEKLNKLAERDQLTGIFNRRKLDGLISYELSKRRRDERLALMMIDIDYFKNVNDTYGHDMGDMVLKELTKCIMSTMRTGDTIGRWGGEEFIIIVPDTTSANAKIAAERIRRRVAETSFGLVGHVTISIGITSVKKDDTTESLFARVDKALYDAKNNGRNCVAIR
jgi:diguanylate cyclase (GGDEF)-like protein